MRRGLLLFVPLVAGCWGWVGSDPCEGRTRPPPIHVTGRVVEADGGPIPGAQLWGIPTARDGGAWSDDAGAFAFDVSPFATVDGVGEAVDCAWGYSAEVSTTVRMDAGVWASVDFRVTGSGSVSPDAGVRTHPMADLVVPANDVSVEYRAGTVVARADAGVSSMSVCGPGAASCRGEGGAELVLDVRELEDFDGFSVTAETRRYEPSGYGTYASKRAAPLIAGSWVPPSRGAPCTIGTKRYTPCPLTDGDLQRVTFPAGATQVAVELPSPVTIGHAQLRGFTHGGPSQTAPTFNYQFEASSDGTTWLPLGERSASNLMPAYWEFVTPREEVRHVRVKLSAGAGTALTGGAELSLY